MAGPFWRPSWHRSSLLRGPWRRRRRAPDRWMAISVACYLLFLAAVLALAALYLYN